MTAKNQTFHDSCVPVRINHSYSDENEYIGTAIDALMPISDVEFQAIVEHMREVYAIRQEAFRTMVRH